jgi:hypothetical protein
MFEGEKKTLESILISVPACFLVFLKMESDKEKKTEATAVQEERPHPYESILHSGTIDCLFKKIIIIIDFLFDRRKDLLR